LSPKDDERTFERFIRSIRLCNNLSDARRLRNEITAQLKRDAKVELTEGWIVYLRRLETGKRAIDQKVAQLSIGRASPAMARTHSEMFVNEQPAPSRLEFATLNQVLGDSSGLSYFMVGLLMETLCDSYFVK
jgi:sorting nexin-25